MANTTAEENYIKAIFHLSKNEKTAINTNAIANELDTAAATVTDMVKKLADKRLIKYEPYKGVMLSKSGLSIAGKIVRKHRLWETFLLEKLNFKWDEVHEIAEQLEHIQSDELINRLDAFLNYPKTDPHGDVIPDENGNFNLIATQSLKESIKHAVHVLMSVADQSVSFLKMLDKLKIKIGSRIKIIEVHQFDGSMQVKIDNQSVVNISEQLAKNLIVK